jgi:hypothetical protein
MGYRPDTLEGVFLDHRDIIKNALPPVERQGVKLSCGAVVDVDDPGHFGVGRP